MLRKAAPYFLLAIPFVARVACFAFTCAGVEHDSGWYLGVARNLAHRGIYASYVNTIEEETPGPHPSIHQRFSVQDADGYSYFPAGVTVGPGYVVPEAIALRLFGDGWWQYRFWPLVTYGLLIASALWLAGTLGGWLGAALLAAWLWAVPQFTIIYGYEAFAEDIALLYLLASFALFALASREKPAPRLLLASGLFFSFAILTKQLFLLCGAAFVPFAALELWRGPRRAWAARWAPLAAGVVLPLAAFEAYRFFALWTRFGWEGYAAINRDIALTYKTGGSGLGAVPLPPGFFATKLRIFSDVGVGWEHAVWPVVLLCPLALLAGLGRSAKRMLALCYLAMLVSFAWFLALSPTGWARHAWHPLFLGMLFLCAAAARGVRAAISSRSPRAWAATLLIAVAFLATFRRALVEPRFTLNDLTVTRWRAHRNDRGQQGFPSVPVFSLEDQKALVAYFRDYVTPDDRVFYFGGLLVAEMATLVDKVFYPHTRYFRAGGPEHVAGRGLFLLGPYQTGPWSLVDSGHLDATINYYCGGKTLFRNASYALCELPRAN